MKALLRDCKTLRNLRKPSAVFSLCRFLHVSSCWWRTVATPPSPSITNGSITSCLTCRNCKLEHIVYYGITPPHSLYLFYYHWQINGFRRAFSLGGACWWSDAEVEGVLLFWSMVQYNIRLTTFQCTREEVPVVTGLPFLPCSLPWLWIPYSRLSQSF